MLYCFKCGKQIEEGVKYCSNCGYDFKSNLPSSMYGKVQPTSSQPSSNSKHLRIKTSLPCPKCGNPVSILRYMFYPDEFNPLNPLNQINSLMKNWTIRCHSCKAELSIKYQGKQLARFSLICLVEAAIIASINLVFFSEHYQWAIVTSIVFVLLCLTEFLYMSPTLLYLEESLGKNRNAGIITTDNRNNSVHKTKLSPVMKIGIVLIFVIIILAVIGSITGWF